MQLQKRTQPFLASLTTLTTLILRATDCLCSLSPRPGMWRCLVGQRHAFVGFPGPQIEHTMANTTGSHHDRHRAKELRYRDFVAVVVFLIIYEVKQLLAARCAKAHCWVWPRRGSRSQETPNPKFFWEGSSSLPPPPHMHAATALITLTVVQCIESQNSYTRPMKRKCASTENEKVDDLRCVPPTPSTVTVIPTALNVTGQSKPTSVKTSPLTAL